MRITFKVHRERWHPDSYDIKVIAGILRVERANAAQRYSDPNGKYPVCIPGIGTGLCERCGNDWHQTFGNACPAVPPEQRWSVRYLNSEEEA